MGWHYVFETAPLWAVVVGVVTSDFFRWCRESGRAAIRVWWIAMLITSLLVSWVSVPGLWSARFQRGQGEVNFSRLRYEEFNHVVQSRITPPAIIFVRHNPEEVHIDYVTNTPELNGPILRARAPDKEFELRRAIALFPDRNAWLFDVAAGTWTQLTTLD